ncbi:COMM domain-containing protein 10 [Orussus abietinus]|uniref:COMM domain-containing protein 10 n=1 Tax=Orussus abietinus TaxID=222816 RepID=UPI00062680F5|nr:COMM domain-containing protein 10 [Orussus abietinus]XP_012277463.1 COMM domain-containing protein 10 [Orussus abietinus]XP_012277464.1 COMM domain-containing protein 10 [Orussus abietinus]
MDTWNEITPSVRKGLKIVERLDCGKFRLLVNRICQSLELANDNRVFSDEEEEKLMISLDLNKDELDLLLDTITKIYKQAAYCMMKPAVMETLMKDKFNIGEDKIAALLHAWVTHAKNIVDAFRKKSIFPNKVDNISWHLNVETSSSFISKEARPVVLLQLDLSGESSKKLTVEMDKSELTDLYHSLEKIQNQLDSLK